MVTPCHSRIFVTNRNRLKNTISHGRKRFLARQDNAHPRIVSNFSFSGNSQENNKIISDGSGEAEFYRQKSNCIGYLLNKYHRIVANPKYEIEKKTRRLFSLVHTDLADIGEQLEQKVTTAKKEAVSYLVQNALRHRKEGKPRSQNLSGTADQGIVLSSPASANRIADDSSTRLMTIMADIQPGEEFHSLPEEVTLCSLKVNADGILTVSPDFNTWKNSYCLHNSKMDVFEYVISHSSRQMTKEEGKQELKVISSVLSESQVMLEKQVGPVFEIPATDLFKVYLFGEIASAEGFGPSNLHVCYSIHIPEGWVCEDKSWLSGVSQKCRPKVDGLEDSAYFSFPFEGELSFPYKKTLHGPDGLEVKWPLLFVEIWSSDYWDCLRSEGYAYTTIPSTPGCHTLTIATWKPVVQTIRSQLQHFFFGGMADIDDLSLVAVPQLQQGCQLSKLGFQTESVGRVTIRLNIVHQAESFLHQVSKKHTLLDKLELSATENSVDAILAAFNRARQRMLAARASLL